MPRHDMSFQIHMAFFRNRTGALENGVETPGGGSGFFSYLFNELRHVVDLFDRNHVEIRIVLFGDRKRDRQRVKRVFRAVIGMKDSAEHRTPPASLCFSAHVPERDNPRPFVWRILQLGFRQEMVRQIECVGNHRRNNRARDNRRDKRRILARVDDFVR